MYSFESRVRFSEVDANQQLTMLSVLNYLQDCSTFHSENAHMNITELREYGYAWLLASWQIVINRLPHLGEHIKTSTWPYDFKGFTGHRNFTIEDEAGQVCVYANSQWTFVNLNSMRPNRILPDVAAAYPLSEEFPMEKAPRKIKLLEEGKEASPILVQKNQIDVHQHVNNAMYVAMAQGFLPEDFETLQIRVEYKNAAVLGDTIYPVYYESQDLFQVALKDADGGIYAVVEFTRR